MIMNEFNNNCCDGIYNSFDVHFTSLCDNNCAHCIDTRYNGITCNRPDVEKIVKTIVEKQEGYDDVLFLGGEPCLFLKELVYCVKELKAKTDLKLFVTTAVPKTCFDNRSLFIELLELVDGINLSVQSHDEKVADEIRRVKSTYNRQAFYSSLPMKNKIRINLNIVKPYLYTKADITECLKHYDRMGFSSIKISEIQHGKEFFVSFEETFGIKLGSPYYHGCQKYLDMDKVIADFKTPVLLKRSCFACEETLKAGFMDGVKVVYKMINRKKTTKYGVVYGNGVFNKGWM
jgi:organic radical activating enzyme